MVYRAYKIFLNVNSVSDSPTMFSRRVFEILASSTALISTPSIGMEEMLGNFISVVDNEDDARLTLTNLLNDDNFRNKLSHLGYREVMNNHTYRKRIEYVFDKVEIEYEQSSNPLISCITCSNRPSMFDNILKNFEQQIYTNKELILLMQAEDEEFEEIKSRLSSHENITLVRQLEHELLGFVFNKELTSQKDITLRNLMMMTYTVHIT